MRPYIAIAVLALIAGASAYVVDGLMVAVKVFAIALLIPGVFLVGYRYWLSGTRRRGNG